MPLRETDQDVKLDLQAIVNRVYVDGAFASINYARPLNPPLSQTDAQWVAEQIASRRS